MTVIATPTNQEVSSPAASPGQLAMRRLLRSGRFVVGGGLLLVVMLLCVGSLPWTLSKERGGRLYFNSQEPLQSRVAPSSDQPAVWLGTDALGRPMLGRALLGGAISLGIGVLAATLAVFMGVTIGLVAGYAGGWIDNTLMRLVDVLYSLPYVLVVILLKMALEPLLLRLIGNAQAANLIVLFLSIGMVSWLTMSRVVRGQVLSLRAQPFIEACRAMGLPWWRILVKHLLPNLIGPVIVYATLALPQAILQESFLSFLGIGIQPPMPTWGEMASGGLMEGLNPIKSHWWMLVVPCTLLALTLLSLNSVGDALRDVLDPKREQGKL